METVLFGRTGLRVSRFCLGTMTFGTAWGWGADRSESERMFNTFLEAGGNFVDTANKYTDGESESILGSLLAPHRRKVILATKYSLCMDSEDANSLGNHRRNLVLSVEDSLRRLKTDFIDLLWVHAWYFENRVEDVVRALDDLTASGKILSWGLSDTPAWICSEANTTARLRGWEPLSAIQIEYSLIERTGERELLPFAEYEGIGVAGSIPLGGGLLTGKHHTTDGIDTKRAERAAARRNDGIDRIVDTVHRLATKLAVTEAQLSLAWVLRSRPSIVPILGARTTEQLQENFAALSLELDDETLHELDDISKVDLGFPHEMLAGARMQEVMYGPFSSLTNASRRCSH